MRSHVSFRYAVLLGMLALLLALPVSSLGASAPVPRQPSSAADWATFTAHERAAALAHQRTQFEAAQAAGTLEWTSVSGNSAAISSHNAAQPAEAEAVTTLDYNCGLSWTFVGSGTWTYGWAWVDTSYPAYNIYAGKPPTSTMDQFIRSGTILQYFYKYSVGAGSSYEYANSDSNFKWWFENINYRTKAWLGVQRYQGGAWQLGPNQYCTVAANP